MDDPKVGKTPMMVEPWVRSTMDKLLAGANPPKQTEVCIVALILLGPDGFSTESAEETTNFDPREYGPAMLEGYSMMAALGLAKVFNTVDGALHSPGHFTADIEDPAERIAAMRNVYERAMRGFLQSAITYAGEMFQRGKKGDMSVAAGSQMLNMWLEVSRRTVRFEAAKEPPDEGQDVDGDGDAAGGEGDGPTASGL